MRQARHRLFTGGSILVAVIFFAASLVNADGFFHSKPAGASQSNSPGYWLFAADGGVYQFGAANFGSMRGQHLNAPIVGGAAKSDGLGYWMAASDGGVFTFGDAAFYGSAGNIHLNQPIVGMAGDQTTGGYWMVAADGGIFGYNAPFYGSTGSIRLNKPIVGMASTPSGHGYWLVASDGGIFNFGDAKFYGSTGNIHLNQPVVGMASTPSGHGYWLVAADGGIFDFGDATFYGSTGGIHLNKPIVAMAATADGGGYWLAASDGGTFNFGDAPYLGSTGAYPGPAPIVAIASTAHGYPFPPGSTGYDISQWQCHNIPSSAQAISIVQVTGGAINNSPNDCYAPEAAWAGTRISAYIFMDGLPNPPPAESLSGPAGNCTGNVSCESYNFGWYWANHWVAYSRSLGIGPNLWWLDVETGPDVSWSADTSSNSQVIAGAVGALRAQSVVPGIYATALQWNEITGSRVQFPGISLWVPGAGNVSGGTYSAQSFCAGTAGPDYAPFAGGHVVLVQYGYSGNGYSGPVSPYDQDYACS